MTDIPSPRIRFSAEDRILPNELGELVTARAAIRRDPEAIRAIWREHRQWIAAILLANKPRGVDLEDLLQDVALTMVRKINDLREPAALRGWLRMIALNTALATGREKTRRTRLDREFRLRLTSADESPAGDTREQAEKLLDLARELPEAYREPLVLRCVRGMSYREIAQAMDLPETTVETRISRGRRMLRDKLAQSSQILEGAS